jgi:hypothetical protein
VNGTRICTHIKARLCVYACQWHWQYMSGWMDQILIPAVCPQTLHRHPRVSALSATIKHTSNLQE